jgi:hypothetical protein
MTYPLTFYVKSLPPGVGGTANGPVIRILEKYKDDAGIHAHELCHVLQWFQLLLVGCIAAIVLYQAGLPEFAGYALLAGMTMHSLLYLAFPAYKLWAEVEAYQEQAECYVADKRPLFARFISENYGLKITQADALARLRSA